MTLNAMIAYPSTIQMTAPLYDYAQRVAGQREKALHDQTHSETTQPELPW